KLLLIGLIAVFVLGPERLPVYAQRFAQWIKRTKVWLDGAQDRAIEELGEDFQDVDWKKMDPRQYDPRRIIKDALSDSPSQQATTAAGASVAVSKAVRLEIGELPPFDSDAT
ncbi:MAG TPA: Sec-independent protein translocase TatB, partial [Microbacteriaceae bacterium]